MYTYVTGREIGGRRSLAVSPAADRSRKCERREREKEIQFRSAVFLFLFFKYLLSVPITMRGGNERASECGCGCARLRLYWARAFRAPHRTVFFFLFNLPVELIGFSRIMTKRASPAAWHNASQPDWAAHARPYSTHYPKCTDRRVWKCLRFYGSISLVNR